MNNFIKKIQVFFILSDKWKELSDSLLFTDSKPNSKRIVQELVDWTHEIKKVNNKHIQDLYNVHLQYYAELNLDEHIYHTSEQFVQNLITFFFKKKLERHTNVCENVASLLQNIIVFRSNMTCPKCNNGMFVYEHKGKEEIVFYCDHCQQYFSEDMNPITINNMSELRPVSNQTIETYPLKPSNTYKQEKYFPKQEEDARFRDTIQLFTSKFIAGIFIPIILGLIYGTIEDIFSFLPYTIFIIFISTILFITARYIGLRNYFAMVVADLWLPAFLFLLQIIAGGGVSEKTAAPMSKIYFIFATGSYIIYIALKFITPFRSARKKT